MNYFGIMISILTFIFINLISKILLDYEILICILKILKCLKGFKVVSHFLSTF